MTFADLTPRRQQIARLVGVEALSSKEIARRLHISPRTVETHRTEIFAQLDVHNVAGLARMLAWLPREGE